MNVYFIDCPGMDPKDSFYSNFIGCLSFLLGSIIFYSSQDDISLGKTDLSWIEYIPNFI